MDGKRKRQMARCLTFVRATRVAVVLRLLRGHDRRAGCPDEVTRAVGAVCADRGRTAIATLQHRRPRPQPA